MTGAISIGDKVRWRRDQYPKTDPEMRTEVIAVYDDGETVRLEGGATAPARMLEVVEGTAPAAADDAGLMQVIETQMAEIDRLMAEAKDRDDMDANDEGWEMVDGVKDRLGPLCIALGFDRHPGLPTGIPELDALVRYVMD